MGNSFFRFKQFAIFQDRCAMKVTTDACLFGAWVADTLCASRRATDNGKTGNTRFLDIGSGSGLLSLMVAQKNNATIDAIELEPAAAGQAIENTALSKWKDQIKVMQADVFQWQSPVKYDVIFSNPPFYENDLRSDRAEKNLAHHSEGLKLQPLLAYINHHLANEGTFFLLLPAKREAEMTALIEGETLFVQQKVLIQQTLEHPPFRVMIQGCRKRTEEHSQQLLSIKNRAGEYTDAFVGLLKDYYLYL